MTRFATHSLCPGTTHFVVLEGLNDICFPGAKMDEQYLADPDEMRTVQDITDALRSKEKVAPTSSAHSATLDDFRAVKRIGAITRATLTAQPRLIVARMTFAI